MEHILETRQIDTDVLIIGGGTAGCYAALTLSRKSALSVLIAEKADIRRSGCLAAGVNALNAYITEGRTPQDYADYAAKDAAGIVRQDLLLTAAELFNEVTADLEQLGLVILKDENGKYVSRGTRNIKINGENIKPILADAVLQSERVTVLNRVNITDLLVDHNKVYGAVGFSVTERKAYIIRAKSVLVATGGAAGLYKPNNPGFSRHKMWYPPFLTGAGYAMGIRAGAEMTSFEMRFVALRCKDTIAPTGTIAQGVGARQVNAKGYMYENQYGIATSERIYGTVMENRLGNGPCYLKTSGISGQQQEELLKAYLNMCPAQTLKWMEQGAGPAEQDVEIEGTEPYVVGGHTASGYWVDTCRETTIRGLFAAGDVAGGCPQKYVTGALAEGKIAAESILASLQSADAAQEESDDAPAAESGRGEAAEAGPVAGANANEKAGTGGKTESGGKTETGRGAEAILRKQADAVLDTYARILSEANAPYTAEELEERMQKVMDEYAGGISTHYAYTERRLRLADAEIDRLAALTERLTASNMHELLFVYELRDRLTVCKTLIFHLLNRKETRWHIFGENQDYPETNPECFAYLNSHIKDGKREALWRKIVTENEFRHTDAVFADGRCKDVEEDGQPMCMPVHQACAKYPQRDTF
ncbi:MAG: adenylyl-sulfate reductase subunit alpha [Clostridiales bacterium]|nr:adenylyl-sulfate reductase subunit alpha [Clostridiales bacterium]